MGTSMGANCSTVIVISCAMGLFGYDNALTSPLVSLPLFVAKYQGPGHSGVYSFTVHEPCCSFCHTAADSIARLRQTTSIF